MSWTDRAKNAPITVRRKNEKEIHLAVDELRSRGYVVTDPKRESEFKWVAQAKKPKEEQ